MVTLQQIEDFLGSGPIAMAGVSRNPKKFGFAAFKELKEKGMNIIPVNPHADEIHGSKVYHDIKSLPDDVKGLIVMTGKDSDCGSNQGSKGERDQKHLGPADGRKQRGLERAGGIRYQLYHKGVYSDAL